MSGFRFSNLRMAMVGRFANRRDKRAENPGLIANLRLASELVETSAFAAAGDQPTAVVSQLIMVSAELERLAQTIEKGLEGST